MFPLCVDIRILLTLVFVVAVARMLVYGQDSFDVVPCASESLW